MQINPTVLNTMLDNVFKASATTYQIKLAFSGDTFSDPETVTFETASGGVTELTASKSFAITSGTTVTGILVINATLGSGVTLISETITNEVYTADGTFTVNNVTITVAAA